MEIKSELPRCAAGGVSLAQVVGDSGLLHTRTLSKCAAETQSLLSQTLSLDFHSASFYQRLLMFNFSGRNFALLYSENAHMPSAEQLWSLVHD